MSDIRPAADPAEARIDAASFTPHGSLSLNFGPHSAKWRFHQSTLDFHENGFQA
jgi:hypothetical protein